MSSFNQDDGFFQTGYENQASDQQYGGFDYSGQQYGQFGQDQQFSQFDYSQQGYGQGGEVYSGSQYTGSIMTPAAQFVPPPGAQVGENYEDEPPLMEELGINFDHITQKTMAVLNPLKLAEHSIMQDTDLAGPLVFCLAFGVSLLLSGKLSFGYIYGIGLVGCVAMYCLLNLMSMTGVSAGVTISVLGYCLLPMVFLSFASVLLSLQGLVGIVLTCVAVAWCSISASKLFVSALAMDSQQPLVAYPCALVYGVFALITVF